MIIRKLWPLAVALLVLGLGEVACDNINQYLPGAVQPAPTPTSAPAAGTPAPPPPATEEVGGRHGAKQSRLRSRLLSLPGTP